MCPPPPEIAPLLWVLGGPWHGRKIPRPGRSTAFEVARLLAGSPWIDRYRYHEPWWPAVAGVPPLYADGWQGDVGLSGCWCFEAQRPGISNRDVHYYYREG